MQVVGRPCEICTRVIKSKLDGVGCVTCERFFHDACVVAPPVELAEAGSETYRTQASKPKKRSKRASRNVLCPSCGADVRKEERERDRVTAAVREEHEERRRVQATTQGRRDYANVVLVRFGLLFFLLAIVVLANLFHGR